MPPPTPEPNRIRPPLHLLEILPAPPANEPPEWLSAREKAVFASLKIDKRRSDWLTGRRAAKEAMVAALAAWLGEGPRKARLEILADDDGAPAAWLDGRRLTIDGREPGLSLTHSGSLAAALVAPPGVRCGCDLEQLEPRSDALIADHFTATEIARIQAAPSREAAILATNLTWSAKEAALKLLRTGLRRDTRSVEVEWGEANRGEVERSTADDETVRREWASLPVTSWHHLRVVDLHASDPPTLTGWWLRLPTLVLSVVCTPPTPPPLPRLTGPVPRTAV